jgi:hypothetical protein
MHGQAERIGDLLRLHEERRINYWNGATIARRPRGPGARTALTLPLQSASEKIGSQRTSRAIVC